MSDILSLSHRHVFARAWLSLSGDQTIDRILADIPFFSVGLLAFGVFTLFVVIKRVNVLSIHLSTSVLLAFLAATLDLGQILSGTRSNGQDHLDPVTGLSTVSGVGFALSVGFRYLFFWSFVAERPRGEPPPQQPPIVRKNGFSGMSGREQIHSGSWSRWGFLGFILKWSTLALVLVIPLMQILWRTVTAFDQYGPVYVVEATIEIVASAVFILKLILNIYLITATTGSKALLYYTAPILALLISLGLGIGNSIHFALSETSLGRLLQAVELYILFVFILIMTFYKVFTPHHPVTQRTRVATFQGLPEKPRESAFHINPPVVLTPEPIMVIGDPTSNTDDTANAARASNASRLSGWMVRRLSRRQLSWDERQLWNRGDAEEGVLPTSPPPTRGGDSLDILGPRVEELKGPMNLPSHVVPEGSLERLAAVPTALPQTSINDKEAKEVNSASQFPSSSFETRPTTFSVSSYYGSIPGRESPELTRPGMSFPRNTESPVYGLNGIIKRQYTAPAPRPVSSVASFDELLRLQQELDKSIAALRLFSADDGVPSETKLSDIIPLNGSSTDQSVSSIKVLRKHESGSGRSEFSLSSFPEPPEVSTSPPSPSSLGPLRARQKQSRITRKDDETTVPIINVPVHNDITVGPMDPASRGSEVFGGTSRSQRLDSAGTQYDVTSFIDDLTVPESGGLTGLTSAFRSAIIQPAGLSDIESVDDSPTEIRNVHSYNRPIITGPAGLDSGPSLGPATASSGLLSSRLSRLSIGHGALTQNNRPALTVTFEQPLTSIYRNPNLRNAGVGVGLPSYPRMATNKPHPPLAGVSEDEDAFERPRPPPLFLQDKALTNVPTGF